MKKSYLIVIALAFLLAFPLGASAGPIKLTVAEIHPQDYPTTQGLLKFAELVKERSGGKIVLDVKYGGQLGKGEKKVVEQVQFGALDMARISVSPMTEFVPALEAFGLPYIWAGRDHMWKVLNGPTGQRLLKDTQNYRFYGLAYYEAGARSFYNSKRAVKTVEDLKGLKIRVQKSKLMIDLVNTMGANATPIAFGEVYDAISKGVIDGAENNWPSYESTSHYEVAKYYTLDTHTMVP
ncbi:MAG: TRAP transporter substrate-binding protein, partial [Desulfobacterales bacterium]|nr:TRAP transporter substrate-binding protein [Desulfobacterales bacterium]